MIEALTGPPGPGRPDVYADTSPEALLPLGVRQVLVHGQRDDISPPAIDLAYAAEAARKGDMVQRRLASEAGHFELIAPPEITWAASAAQIVQLLTR